MSRLTFGDLTELMKWVEDPKDPVTPIQYQVIITSYNEVIFAPTKSTRSLRYGYYKTTQTEIEEILEEIRVNPMFRFMSVIQVKSFDWDTTKPVRSREEE